MIGCGKRTGLGPGIRGMGRCGATVIMGSVFVCETCRAKAARAAKKAAKEDRKPKPAPAEGAAEGRYAVAYQTATMPHAKMDPHVFLSRAQVDEWLAWNKHRADGVVRILPDGALEAACEAARREERERVCADTKKAIEKYVWDHSSVDVTHIYKLLDEAAKGQAK